MAAPAAHRAFGEEPRDRQGSFPLLHLECGEESFEGAAEIVVGEHPIHPFPAARGNRHFFQGHVLWQIEDSTEGEGGAEAARRPEATRVKTSTDSLLLNLQRFTMLPSQQLSDIRMMILGRDQRPPSLSDFVVSSTPIAMVMRMPWVRRFILTTVFIACVIIGCAMQYLASLPQGGLLVPYRHYRFSALETRNGSVPTSPGIRSFGLILPERNAPADTLCLADKVMNGASWTTEGAQMTLTLGTEPSTWSERPYTAWYLVTAIEGDAALDPSRFVLEGSDDASTWTRVGGVGVYYVGKGTFWTRGPKEIVVALNWPIELPFERERVVNFPMRPEFGAVVGFMVAHLAILMLLLVFVMGHTFGFRIGFLSPQNILPVALATMALLKGVAGVWSFTVPSFKAGGCLLAQAVLFGFSAVLLRRMGSYWHFICAGCKVLEMLVLVSHHKPHEFFSRTDWWDVLESRGFLDGFWWILLVPLILATRLRFALSCVRAVRADRRQYDKQWEQIKSEQHAKLLSLGDVTSRMSRVLKCMGAEGVLRQTDCVVDCEDADKIKDKFPMTWLDDDTFLSRKPEGCTMEGKIPVREMVEKRSEYHLNHSLHGVPVSSHTRVNPLVSSPRSKNFSVSPSRESFSQPMTPSFSQPMTPSSPQFLDSRRLSDDSRTTHALASSTIHSMQPPPIVASPEPLPSSDLLSHAPSQVSSERPSNPSKSVRWPGAESMEGALGIVQTMSRALRASTSLDVLHAQACLLDDILWLKAVKLANAHAGKFLQKRSSRSKEWHFSTCGIHEGREGLDVGRVKGISRSMEKADKVYGGDVSRLLDVVRQTVYFDDVANMTSCLQAIESDEELQVVSVKSSMDVSYPPSNDVASDLLFSGLRFVKVNARCTAQDASNLCLDGHVCELVLMLTSMACLRSRASHVRYKNLVNASGIIRSGGYGWLLSLLLPKEASPALRAPNSSGVRTGQPLSPETLTVERCASSDIRADADNSSGMLERADSTFASAPNTPDVSSGTPAHKIHRSLVSALHKGWAARRVHPEPRCISTHSPAPTPPISGTSTLNDTAYSVNSGCGERENSWGLELDEDLFLLLQGYARMAALGLTDMLDAMWRKRQRFGAQNASLGSVLFTASPVTVAATKTPIQFLLFFFAALYAGFAIRFLLEVATPSCPMYQHFRLLTKETRNGTFYPEAPGLSAFGAIDWVHATSPCSPASALDPDKLRRDWEGGSESHWHRNEYHPADHGHDYLHYNFDSHSLGTSAVGGSLLTSYDTAVHMKAWYVATAGAHSNPDLDAVYFEVYGTNDPVENCTGHDGHRDHDGHRHPEHWCGVEWTRLAVPIMRTMLGHTNKQSAMSLLPADMPLERNEVVTFHAPHAWPFVLLKGFEPLFFLVATIAFILSGRYAKAQHARVALATGLSGKLLVYFVVGSAGVGKAQVVDMTRHSILVFVLLMGVLRQSERIVRYIWVAGVCDFVVNAMVNMRTFCEPGLFSPIGTYVPSMMLLTVAFVCSVTRRRLLSSSIKLIQADMLKYDAMWAELCSSDDGQQGIEHLSKVVNMLGLDEEQMLCKQYNRRSNEFSSSLGPDVTWFHRGTIEDTLRRSNTPRSSTPISGHTPISALANLSRIFSTKRGFFNKKSAFSSSDIPSNRIRNKSRQEETKFHAFFSEIGFFPLPRAPNLRRPIDSVDQIYAQAAVVRVLLVHHLRAWVSASGGKFPRVKDQGARRESMDWRECCGVDEEKQRTQWMMLKRQKRAMEKVLRSYGGDVSRLLDVCRAAVVFDTMQDLTHCLGEIITDDQVRVERIKNRMSKSYDAAETAGYRDVCVNLRVINPTAIALGAELHMCEVQLILKGFAQLKTSEGHKRYVRLRNMKAT